MARISPLGRTNISTPSSPTSPRCSAIFTASCRAASATSGRMRCSAATFCESLGVVYVAPGIVSHSTIELVDGGTRIVKLMLHISKEEQRARLLKRLDRPDKLWKFKPEDVDERQRWDEYQAAYEIALERCNTEWAPWYVVPSDRKWYRTLAVASLLRDTLASFDLDWPEPDFDVEEQKARLGA